MQNVLKENASSLRKRTPLMQFEVSRQFLFQALLIKGSAVIINFKRGALLNLICQNIYPR
jgi:hypothetical protein